MAHIEIVIPRGMVTRDKRAKLAPLYDELLERLWAAIQAAKAQSATQDREWQERQHPRAPDGRFGNKAGEHGKPEGLAGNEKPRKEDLKATSSKARLAELLTSGHPFTKQELMELAGIEKESTFSTLMTMLKSPKYSGPRNALQIVKNKDGTFHVIQADGKPAPPLEKPTEAPKPPVAPPVPVSPPRPAPPPKPAPPAPPPPPAPTPAPAPVDPKLVAAGEEWGRMTTNERLGLIARAGLVTKSIENRPWHTFNSDIQKKLAAGMEMPKPAPAPAPTPAKPSGKWKPAKSANEASKRAVAEGYLDAADFKGISTPSVNEIMDSVSAHMTEFPALRQGHKMFVGSNGGIKQHVAQLQADRYVAELKRHKPDITPEELEASVKSAERYFSRTKIPTKAWATAWNTAHMRSSEWRGVAVNASITKDQDALKKMLQRSVQMRYHPPGCDTIKSIMDHELGHQMDYLLGLRNDPKIAELRTKAYGATNPASGQPAPVHNGVPVHRDATENMTGAVSKYAHTNVAEFIAEAWAEYRNSPEPRYIAQQVGDHIKKLYAEKFPS